MKIIRPITISDSGSFVRASTGTYVDKNGVTQTAAVNVPRFTYDPADLTKPPAIVTADIAFNTLGMLSVLAETDAPTHDATKCYVLGDRVLANHIVYESSVGRSASVGFVSGTAAKVVWAQHGLLTGAPFQFTGGTAPAGTVLNTTYYVLSIVDINSFTFAATVGGAAINTSSTGTGLIATTAENLGRTPTLNPSVWLNAGPSNKWAMFDQSVESQTSALDYVAAVIKIPSDALVDRVVVKNIANAKKARVTMIDPLEGVVYDKVIDLISDSGINDPYAMTFEPIVYLEDFMVTDLPRYAGAFLCVSMANTGNTVKCGLCVVGLTRVIGWTQAGVQTGIQDYSVKETDEFGNSTINQRSFASTMNATVWVDKTQRTSVIKLLNQFRATPIMYIADDDDPTTWQYGYFRDYSNGIDQPTVSVLNIEIESLK